VEPLIQLAKVNELILSAWRSDTCVYIPNGVTFSHLKTSITIAVMYGSEGSSVKSGRRVPPRISSNSFCALIWTSGWVIMARTKIPRADTVYSCMMLVRE